jgi:hypothetical protein
MMSNNVNVKEELGRIQSEVADLELEISSRVDEVDMALTSLREKIKDNEAQPTTYSQVVDWASMVLSHRKEYTPRAVLIADAITHANEVGIQKIVLFQDYLWYPEWHADIHFEEEAKNVRRDDPHVVEIVQSREGRVLNAGEAKVVYIPEGVSWRIDVTYDKFEHAHETVVENGRTWV